MATILETKPKMLGHTLEILQLEKPLLSIFLSAQEQSLSPEKESYSLLLQSTTNIHTWPFKK